MCWRQRSATTWCSTRLPWLEELLENLPLFGSTYTIITTDLFSSLGLEQRKRKFLFVLQTGSGCLFEWGIFLFLKNCVMCCFWRCYGLRQPLLTLFETTVSSFSPSDLKLVPGRGCREDLQTAYGEVSVFSWRSPGVMQIFQTVSMFRDCVWHKQWLTRGVLTVSWPNCQILNVHIGSSVTIKCFAYALISSVTHEVILWWFLT